MENIRRNIIQDRYIEDKYLLEKEKNLRDYDIDFDTLKLNDSSDEFKLVTRKRKRPRNKN